MTLSVTRDGADLDAERKRLEDRHRTLVDESTEIAARADARGFWTDGERERLERIQRGLTKNAERLEEVTAACRDRLTEAVMSSRSGLRVESGSDTGPEVAPPAVADSFDRARAVIDDMHSRGVIHGEAAETAEGLVTTGGHQDRTKAARWVEVTGRPAYARAFQKLVADPEKGHLLWTRDEHEAFRDVELFRAMSLTDASGGYMVPFQLDPSIMLSSDGSINPIRQIARKVTATGDVWNGVSSAGVTAEWLAEAAEAADASPTLAQPSITIYKGSAWLPYSYEVGMDAANFLEEMGKLLSDGADQIQATAFTTGNGTTQPFGIVTALTGTGSVVTSAAADTFGKVDVYSTQEALGPRFQPRAQWIASLPILNDIAQFETTNGAKEFPEVGQGRLLRKPIHECSNLDSTITALSDNYVMVYGDWSHYVVADRIGTTVEMVPQVFGANRRPTGQRGMFLWFRVGADAVVNEAFSVLNVT